MKHKILVFMAFCLTLQILAPAQQSWAIDLEEDGYQKPEFLPADKAFPFSIQQRGNDWQVTWTVTEGYYLYRDSISIENPETEEKLGKPEFNREAEIKFDPNFNKDMAIFHGKLIASFSFENSLPENAVLTFQGCAEAGLCYPMQKHALIHRPEAVGEDRAEDGKALELEKNLAEQEHLKSLWGNLSYQGISGLLEDASLLKISLIFLLLGIGLCFTPCVLPMIPIISGLVMGRKDLSTTQAFLVSSTYVLFMAAAYTLAGVVAASLGASANIQIWMQTPWVLSIFAGIFALLSLSMFGFYELQLPGFINEKLNELSNRQQGGTYIGAAIMGVISAIVVSPCVSAPLAGALVFISSTGNVGIGASALFSLGIGMGLPLIALSTFETSFLPKGGNWLNYSKRFFGLLLLAVAIWLLARFMSGQAVLVLWGALLILASFSFGAWSRADALLKLILTILLLWGVLCIIGAALGNSNPLQPLENLSSDNRSTVEQKNISQFTTITSVAQLNQALETHKNTSDSNKKILLLDFYADWCTSCIELEHEIFENPEFENFLQQTTLIRADLSENSPENFELLESLNVFGPPAILFFDSNGEEVEQLRILGTVKAKAFRETINQLPE